MTISADIFRAILAMDVYNRGYNAGVNISGTQIGNAVLSANSQILGTGVDAAASFFAQAYTITDSSIAGLDSGRTIISYRGTDALMDVFTGWTTWAEANFNSAQQA